MDFETIYRQHPETYQALVAQEDYQSNLARALRRLLPADGGDVLDMGTGTGRVARQLAGDGRGITASDRSLPMLRTAAGLVPEEIAWLAADNRQLPFRPGFADLVIAGWSLGHSVAWYADSWPREIGRALEEMLRIARPGGMLAVIETLGTGQETPLAPTQALADYYHWMEAEHGFDRQWMRTDYLFEDVAQAERLMRFFFGDEMGDQVRVAGIRLVPECTGLWTRRADGRA
jgi:ubiquinone/menaquinone biosynthesis C-methylase UbiE